ncbi:hypothetical protein BHE90_017559, partial [Fusarium euwallaceae]
ESQRRSSLFSPPWKLPCLPSLRACAPHSRPISNIIQHQTDKSTTQQKKSPETSILVLRQRDVTPTITPSRTIVNKARVGHSIPFRKASQPQASALAAATSPPLQSVPFYPSPGDAFDRYIPSKAVKSCLVDHKKHHITSQRIVRQRTYTLSTGHFAASTAAAIIIIIIPTLLSFSFRSRGLVPSDLTRYRLFRWRQPV